MNYEFYGADSKAQAKISHLLQLETTGIEQDWEIEFADINRIEEMLFIFEYGNIDVDSQCALALLIIASIDEAENIQNIQPSILGRVKHALSRNEIVRKRMDFFWIKLEHASNISYIKNIVTI